MTLSVVTVLSFLFVLTVLIAVHEWGHYRMAAAVGVRVLTFSIGFGRPLLKWQPRRQPTLDGLPQTTQFIVAALPFGGYVRMLDERETGFATTGEHERRYALNRKPLWARALIVLAGPGANLLLAMVAFATVNWVGRVVPEPIVVQVIEGGAAQAAGVLVGDKVLSVDGQAMDDSGQLVEHIRFSTNAREQRWLVQRHTQSIEISIMPEVVEEEHAVAGHNKIGRVGIALNTQEHLREVRLGLVPGLWQAARQTYRYCALTLRTLAGIAMGEASVRNLSGPLTVAQYSGQTAQAGFASFLFFIGLVSVGLGMLNLLPLPMLDGGHLVYYLWEAVSGEPVSEWWLDKLQRVGFGLILLLSVLALYNDTVRLVGLQSFFK